MNGQNDWIILHSSAARRVKYMDVWSAYFFTALLPEGLSTATTMDGGR
jgi:hypothetical protein